MRVLYINDTHNVPGGAEAILLYLIPAVQHAGIEVFVACIPGSEVETKFKDGGITTLPVSELRKNPLLAIRRIVHICREHSIDLIHTGSLFGNFSGRLAGRKVGVPVITTVHCEPDAFLLTKSSFFRRLNWRLRQAVDRMTVGYASALIAVSKGVADKLIAQGIPAGKVTVVVNGIDVSRIQAQAALVTDTKSSSVEQQIGVVARLEAVKGIQYLIEAVSLLAPELPDLKLVIIGAGSLKNELVAQSRDLGIEERVTFLGYLENPMPQVAKLTLFVLPSLSEGLNVILLEAMAIERPVVATGVGGNSEVIQDRKTGLLVPPRDAAALAIAIKELLSKPELAAKLGKAGARLVEERFSESVMCESVINMYKKLGHHD
ncbi:MAG TPA: glycosyltransferase family 1 protein [Actinobacteria bacterium]|nr:glycosyltransferase family 1 protein [Actinomycetota bacterium]